MIDPSHDDILPLPPRWRDRLARLLLAAPDERLWRAMARAYALACLCHLLIADAWQLSWLAADLVLLSGALILVWRACALGYLLALPGLLYPLLFLRDQLTQSVLLALFAASAALALLLPRTSWRQARASWRLITTSTYTVATLHKLNRDFFDPQVSCATYGFDEVLRYWQLPPAWLTDHAALATALPYVIVLTEASIALLYLLRLRRLNWLLILLFHLPLTLVMAPAFVFVMLAGHSAFLEESDLDHARAWLLAPRRAAGLLLVASLATALSLWRASVLPEWSMWPRELLIWLLIALCLTFGAAILARAPRQARALHGLPIAMGFLFWINALSPYSGRQYQHAGAMLSNLRIDAGCWNSLILPEAARSTDDYIRVDEVYFGEPGRDPEYEAVLRDHLWSPPQLRQMQRNWCAPSRRPFALRGTWRGAPLHIEDLCSAPPEALPFSADGIFGVELFPDALRFQKNLARACPQRCIH